MKKLLISLLLLLGCGSNDTYFSEADAGVDAAPETLTIIGQREQIGFARQALSQTVIGVLKYENHWDPVYAGPQSYFRFPDIVGTHPVLPKVRFCLRQSSPLVELCTFTDDNGSYSIPAVPTGVYTPRVYWETSDSKFRLTNGDTGGNVTWFSDNSLQIAISPSNMRCDQTFGLSWPAADGVASASTYMVIRWWFDTLGVTYGLNSDAFFTGMGTILVKNNPAVTSASTTYVQTQITAAQTNNIVWHELGHTLEENMHNQRWGSHGIWKSGAPYYGQNMVNCLTPTGSSQLPSNHATKEGWADFVMGLIEFSDVGAAGAGTNTCAALGFCGVSNVSTTNPLTMPACGAGSSGRSRNVVAQALTDLVDTADVNPLGNCMHDTVSLTVAQVVKAMRDTNWTSTSQPWGNSQIDVDEVSLPSMLYTVQQETGVHMYNIWADSCFQPGRAFGALLQ